mmetsp:Transcript_5338/g.8822  ORF Transcript_5338/g.8822 Transcript_5338/m.8822 type:complete len:1000 (+) Transcript_5338:185-3184(+)
MLMPRERRRTKCHDDLTLGDPVSISLSQDDAAKKKKNGSFLSRKVIISIATVTLILAYFPVKLMLKGFSRQPHLPNSLAEAKDVMEQSPLLRSRTKDERSSSCHHLPSVYWINLDMSKERKNAIVKSMESAGITDQHRVAAYDTEQTTALLTSSQLVFHSKIQLYPGDGNPSFWKHPDNIYTYNEAACLMSHLKAIKQAYDDGREVALIVEDDAAFSSFFCDEYGDYVAKAPEGWKILQFATNNPHVVMHGSLMHQPFISWQRYHHSTRAYLINRSGMETLLGKVHSTTLTGRSMWRVQEFPSVVADEAIYTFTGDSYYSTGLWIDTLDLDSTIQKHKTNGRWVHPYSRLQGREREQINMKMQAPPAHLLDRSLLVVMNVCISDESQIEREIEVIAQDFHAVCKFHQVCEWEINVVAVEASLTTLFEEAASGLPSYVHLHTRVHSEAFNKFLFVRDVLSRLGNFDLILFKDNDQRINGFPWRTFVERSDNAVISSPLRSTQRDHMLFSTKEKNSQDVQLHDINRWLLWWNPKTSKKWHKDLFDKYESIDHIEVPFLESYFVLLDAMFAKEFFGRASDSGLLDNASLEYHLCMAALDWDGERPSCRLIPVVSTHEDSLNTFKNDVYANQLQSDPGSNFDKGASIANEWKEIVGKQQTVFEMEQVCLKRMKIKNIDADNGAAYEDIPVVGISDCARTFIDQYRYSLPPVEAREVDSSTKRDTTTSNSKPRLEFVHITKTGGSAIEKAAATVGITWGACHYMELEEVGCSSPDLPYDAPDYQSYALTSPWHTPPKLLKMYVDGTKYPYDDADLFTIIRNPYSRVLSEYYCPWNGFQPKYLRDTVHEKDPGDPKVMNEWVKSMVKRLGVAMNAFNMEKGKVKEQSKGLNEDDRILAQKHYVNQAEYVYDGDEIIVKHVLHYENLSGEFDALMKKYNIALTLPSKDEGVYSEANNERRLSYKDLDPEAIALVNVFAKVDFEKFGYQMVEEKFDENYSLEATIIE